MWQGIGYVKHRGIRKVLIVTGSKIIASISVCGGGREKVPEPLSKAHACLPVDVPNLELILDVLVSKIHHPIITSSSQVCEWELSTHVSLKLIWETILWVLVMVREYLSLWVSTCWETPMVHREGSRCHLTINYLLLKLRVHQMLVDIGVRVYHRHGSTAHHITVIRSFVVFLTEIIVVLLVFESIPLIVIEVCQIISFTSLIIQVLVERLNEPN